MRGEAWSAERIEMLRTLWSAGETAVAIGERLGGKSRSAVLGKVFRLRLESNHVAAAAQAAAKTAEVRGERPNAPARRRRQRIKPPQIPPKPLTQYKSLLELTNQTCRWPHGRPGTQRFFFCGAPEADLEQGRPYCSKHMQRAYSPCFSPGKAHSTPALRRPEGTR
jgi:GcrA cell cycle regulator